MSTHTAKSILGRNHRETNKRKQKFEFRKTRPAYNSRLGVMMVEVTWMQPYLAYMVNKTLPEDVVEARRIVR
jgi:hypothetical protein